MRMVAQSAHGFIATSPSRISRSFALSLRRLAGPILNKIFCCPLKLHSVWRTKQTFCSFLAIASIFFGRFPLLRFMKFGTMPCYNLLQVFNFLNHEAVGIVVHTDDRSRSLGDRAAKEIPQFDPRDAVGATTLSWKEIVNSGGLISRLRESFCFDIRHFEMNSAAFYQPTGQSLACQISAAYSLIVRSLEKRLAQATWMIAVGAHE